jgi:polygalacturonase
MERLLKIELVLATILVLGTSSLAGNSRPILRDARLQALSVVENEGRRVCSVLDFGAKGDGIDYDTSAIQSAIDYCAVRGGGVVHVPPGMYLTGTVYLKSNITLRVDHGATILGGTNQADFPAQSSRWYTILAENAENVELTGGGTVTGQGLKFVVEFKDEKNIMVSWNVTGDCVGDECRPRLVGFINCKNVRVKNMFLEQPAYWWYISLIPCPNLTPFPCPNLTPFP